MTRAAAPRLVVVSGPSGVGKTTVCEQLLRRTEIERVVTATTRPARGQESHGVDYLFLHEEEFDEWIGEGRFLEWAQVHSFRYGSPRAQAETILAKGHHALLNVDVQGAAQIRDAGFPCLRVFLLPPSTEELERRLRGRHTDSDEEIARRLETARLEMARQNEFDLTVVNDDSSRAADEIATALGES
ncbi:MAG: guanylate kinase [Planctomycetota bacterium]|jgi:guanylate kinase